MEFKSTNSSYGWLARLLHWIGALLVFALLSVGISMNIVTADLKTTLLQVHIGSGLFLFAVVIVRIIWKFIDDRPDPPSLLSSIRLLVFRTIHLISYIGLLVLTISGAGILISSGVGWSLTEITPDMIARNLPPVAIHSVMFKILFLFVMLHIGGVLSYQLLKADVLHRMGINWFNRKK
jgi:cytochrome b561